MLEARRCRRRHREAGVLGILVNTRGVTRTVLLTRRWAIKIPGCWNRGLRHWWRHLLLGLLANMQEVEFSRTDWPELCPVRYYLPGGWLVVMPRLRILTESEFAEADYGALVHRPGYEVPAEAKADSFGWLNGRIVAVDYGGGGRGGRARRPWIRGGR